MGAPVDQIKSQLRLLLLPYLQQRPSIMEKTSLMEGIMAFWSKKKNEHEEMDQVIREQPGIRQAELARKLEVNRSTVQRRLPSLNEAGYLYWEDEKGGLWPFKAWD